MSFTIAEIVSATGGDLIKGNYMDSINGISTDTRTISTGEAFFALSGHNFDGHQFLEKALSKGASALIVKREKLSLVEDLEGVNVIAIESPLKALQDLANYNLNRYKPIIVGITGSTGKTTTKELVASVLSQKYGVLKTIGNFNNEIGLPLTLFNLNENHQIAVLEMGMSGLGEIKRLTQIAPPEIALITNIGVTHLEKLGSIEGIVQAKGELLEALTEQGTAILNGDDPQTVNFIPKVAGKVCLIAEKNEKADLLAANFKSAGESGIGFTICYNGRTFDFFVPIPGRHNVINALFAVAAGLHFGLDFEQIAQGLLEAKTEKMRLNFFENKAGIKFINDAYNASPSSMSASLELLSELQGERKFAVLGDMLELGLLAESAHRELGREVVEKKIDYLFTLGRLGKLIADEALKLGADFRKVYSFSTTEELAVELSQHLSRGDLVLVKGSRGMGMENIIYCLEKQGEGK